MPHKTKEARREHYRVNRQRIYAKQKEYKAKHRDEIVEYQRDYHKKYYEKNRDEIRRAAREYKQRTRVLPEYAAKRLLVFARYRAKRDGLPFNLSLDDLKIPEVCPVFGVPFVFGEKGNHPLSPSIDRVLPHLGYIKGNTQIISYRANTLKRDASLQEMEMLLGYMRRVTR